MGIPKRDRILGSALSDSPLGSDEQFLDEEGVLEPSSKSAGGHYRRRFVIYVNLLILLFCCLGGVLLLFGELPNCWTSFDSLPIAFRRAARVGISLLIASGGLATAQLALVFWRLRVTPSISGDAIDLLEAQCRSPPLGTAGIATSQTADRRILERLSAQTIALEEPDRAASVLRSERPRAQSGSRVRRCHSPSRQKRPTVRWGRPARDSACVALGPSLRLFPNREPNPQHIQRRQCIRLIVRMGRSRLRGLRPVDVGR